METVTEEVSEIQKFYSGTTVLLTGGSGFLGKIVLEKLLRSCDVDAVYLLLREKKGQDAESRLDGIFKKPLFDKLQELNPNFRKKVSIVNGDCSQPELGLATFDKNTLVRVVDCVIHVAATINFDSPIKSATEINVRAVRDLLRIGKEMKKLKSFVYVSTAFSNCLNKEINEKFYDPPIHWKDLIDMVETDDEEKLKAFVKNALKVQKWPNTYVITKSVAESVIKDEGTGLPISIVRPSIIISTAREPVPGWTDSFYGPTGFLTGVGLGVIHTMQMGPDKIGDIVPADYVANTILASGWDVGKKKFDSENEENADDEQQKEVEIYNYVSGAENPIVWNTFHNLAAKNAYKFLSKLMVWYPFFKMRPNKISNFIAMLFLHFLPALFVDSFAFLLGKSPMMMKTYKQIYKFQSRIAYFLTREWKFTNENTQKLWQKMSPQDKQIFELSMKQVNWDRYFHYYVMGARIYLLKDPLHTIELGIKKWRKMYVLHWFLIILLLYVTYKIGQLLLYTFYFD